MSVIGSNILAGASGQGGGYNLTKSLRFRSSASAYLNRTPAGAGNQKTWTHSVWVKRGILGTSQRLLALNGSTDATYMEWGFSAGDLLAFGSYNTNFRITSQVFRDPSAWYHIVLAFDTTQATAANRVKMYVNGVQVTAFSTSNDPTLNTNYGMNYNGQTNIGFNFGSAYADWCMAEVNFIDGQALTPSSFGSTNALTGVWQPAKYTGTYGTNGFYLPFTNTTSTTTLGYDFSGNSNNWTTNNLSLTAGSTYDSMTDVPTLTSATTANYATLNPLMYRVSNTPAATLSNGNLTSTHTPSAYGTYVFSTIAGIGNKFYYEVTITSLVGGGDVGIDNGQGQYSLSTGRAVYLNDGRKIINGSISAYGASFTTGDVIGVAFDLINGTITFYKNGTSQGVASSSIGTSAYFSFGEGDTGTVYNWNYGQQGFTYTPPTGFVALNTFNLPTPTIGATASTQANDYFDISLWAGDGTGARAITNSGSMQPDWVWLKNRTSGAYSHQTNDSVRGATNGALYTDLTNAVDANFGITSFNSNGFTLGNTASLISSSFASQNGSGSNYVGWQWRASNATAVTNTAGSITSTVSANTTAGFSVATYTGTGANATVGHGLGVAPSMVIVKRRDSGSSPWNVWHTSLTSGTYFLVLNTTAAQASGATRFTALPTSTVINIGTDGDVNANTGTYVAYCFAQVAGYSAFGSYTGNGSSDGTFVFTGFRPRFVMIKRTDSADHWTIQDTSRDTYNVSGLRLYPNQAVAEDTSPSSTAYIDMLSNGFKIRTSDSQKNASGGTYIYYAVAENPFKFSNAR